MEMFFGRILPSVFRRFIHLHIYLKMLQQEHLLKKEYKKVSVALPCLFYCFLLNFYLLCLRDLEGDLKVHQLMYSKNVHSGQGWARPCLAAGNVIRVSQGITGPNSLEPSLVLPRSPIPRRQKSPKGCAQCRNLNTGCRLVNSQANTLNF